MKLPRWAVSGPALVLAFIADPSFAQSPQDQPTKQEIAEAYRSKSGEHATTIPGVRWETWRIKEIRGWSLKFKRLSEDRAIGILTRRYRAAAKKKGICAEYQIIDRVPFPPVNPQIKPSLTVEPSGVTTCR